MHSEEKYRPFLHGWNYVVSKNGEVINSITNNKLNATPNKNGYVSVLLKSESGNRKRFYVHRLVVMAFLGDIPEGYVVNHKNHIRNDNRLENLEIITQYENVKHGVNAGHYANNGENSPRGDNSPHSKITEKDAIEIRERNKKGESYRKLSLEYGVSFAQIGNIVRRVSWRHV